MFLVGCMQFQANNFIIIINVTGNILEQQTKENLQVVAPTSK